MNMEGLIMNQTKVARMHPGAFRSCLIPFTDQRTGGMTISWLPPKSSADWKQKAWMLREPQSPASSKSASSEPQSGNAPPHWERKTRFQRNILWSHQHLKLNRFVLERRHSPHLKRQKVFLLCNRQNSRLEIGSFKYWKIRLHRNSAEWQMKRWSKKEKDDEPYYILSVFL